MQRGALLLRSLLAATSQFSVLIRQEMQLTGWDNYQLLDEVEQNIVICQWRADQLFADAEGRGK